jgi:FtsH-binding integral membrane protein
VDRDVGTIGIVFYMSFGINKMSASKAQTTFWVFAALMGYH